ncbi:MAG: 30S ribosomal protein S4e [Halobacteriota archaeon]
MHQKRLSAPKTIKIPRKEKKWLTSSSPGPHDKSSVPLVVVVRDLLGIANTGREARKAISSGEILVDGVPRKDHRFSLGLFDVVSVPSLEKSYRILFDEQGRYTPKEIEDENLKVYKITGKTIVKGGKEQLNLFDGSNILASGYNVKDSVLLEIPEKKIVDHLKFEEGAMVMITGGSHAGEMGKLKKYRIMKGPSANLVTVEGEEKEYTTIEDYVFVIGKDKPVIDLGV